jgi:hypothetical protein
VNSPCCHCFARSYACRKELRISFENAFGIWHRQLTWFLNHTAQRGCTEVASTTPLSDHSSSARAAEKPNTDSKQPRKGFGRVELSRATASTCWQCCCSSTSRCAWIQCNCSQLHCPASSSRYPWFASKFSCGLSVLHVGSEACYSCTSADTCTRQ